MNARNGDVVDTHASYLACNKKDTNNMKYLTTRLVLFCDPRVTFEDRYKYVVRWDLIFEILKQNKLFQEKSPREKSSVLLI